MLYASKARINKTAPSSQCPVAVTDSLKDGPPAQQLRLAQCVQEEGERMCLTSLNPGGEGSKGPPCGEKQHKQKSMWSVLITGGRVENPIKRLHGWRAYCV